MDILSKSVEPYLLTNILAIATEVPSNWPEAIVILALLIFGGFVFWLLLRK